MGHEAAATGSRPARVLEVRSVKVAPGTRRAWRHGEELRLTAKEFDLLELLIRNAGSVVSRPHLMRIVWNTPSWTSTKTIDVHLGKLRRKLGDDPQDPQLISTVRGYGLRFEASTTTAHTTHGVEISQTARRAWRNGEELRLTAKEFDLLQLLIHNAGRVVSRPQLMRTVWKTSSWTSTRTIDVHLGKLRRKLGDDPRDPQLISTVRGQGLRFEPSR